MKPIGSVKCRTDAVSCDDLDRALSRSWLRIAIAAVFAGQGMVFSLALNMTPPDYGSTPYWVLHGGLMLSSLLVILFLGGPLFRSTWGMLHARRLSIEGLFTLSLLGALVGSIVSSLTGQGSVYYEIVSIVIGIYTCGRMLSERSHSQLRSETDRLREDFEQAMVLETGTDGRWVRVADLSSGSRIRVDPGAPIAVDGVVLEGIGFVRETALTGEPGPVVRRPGDRVRAGTWSVDGAFVIEMEQCYGERELDLILRTVESSDGVPSELQVQANQLIQYFLPLVALVSLSTALYWGICGTWMQAVLNSMAVLLVACPCALGLATPVAIMSGLYRLSRMGLVSRDGALIDALARTKHIYFDKTGTLSESAMRVSERLVFAAWSDQRDDIFRMVRAVESRLAHPIARALTEELSDSADAPEVRGLQIVPGFGVLAQCRLPGTSSWHSIQLGEPHEGADLTDLLDAQRLKDQAGKRVFAYVDDAPAAVFVLQEAMRSGTGTMWTRLQAQGVASTVLTGDPQPGVSLPDAVALVAGVSAAEKARVLESARAAGRSPVFVGDGVNDSAAMCHAAASIAMGSGAAMTQSLASGRLVRDQLPVIPDAIELARQIHRRLRENILYAAIYNVLGMGLACVGWLHPVMAALIMLVSSFWVTTRALQRGHVPNVHNKI